MTRSAPDVPLAALGVLTLQIESIPVDDYAAGREARIANSKLGDCPFEYGSDRVRDWERGWCAVDYALNNPDPEIDR